MSHEQKYAGDLDTTGRDAKDVHPDSPHDLPALGHTPSYDKDTAHVTHEDLHLAGVKRIEAISAQLGSKTRILAFVGVLVLAYAISIDGSIRYVMQTYATSSFSAHSLLITMGVLQGVIGAAGQPVAAKISDVVGRVEMLIAAIVFYCIGTIVEATSNGIASYSGGVVIFQIGFTMYTIMIQVIVTDLSSLRGRLFASFIPPSPWLIQTWVSGNISPHFVSDQGERGLWRWGLGMLAIITPVASLIIITILIIASRRASRAGTLAGYRTPFQQLGIRNFAPHLFWQLDIIGAVLLVASIALFLVPFTLAGGQKTKWGQAHIIAPIVVGACIFPVWVWWERRCQYPLVPFKLLKDRGVWAGLCVALCLNMAWSIQGPFLYTSLIVSFGQTALSATRITSLFTFTSTLAGMALGLVVMKVRRLKAFIIFGSLTYTLAFGLLIRFRGGHNTSQVSGVIGAEVLLGLGAGFFTYPAIASVQARTKHKNVAVVTGLYFALYNLGGALGNVISGSIWNQRMPIELNARLTNATLAMEVYASPYTAIIPYPAGTPEREGITEAYRAVQRILGITGICVCVPLVICALLLRDTRLGTSQSREDAEEDNEKDKERLQNASIWQRLWS